MQPRRAVALAACVAAAAALLVLCTPVDADMYMHNPRGSNNRLNERSANRENGDRLFDSQNNNRGGYNVGDRSDEPFDTNTQSLYTPNPADMYDLSNPVTSVKSQYAMVYYEGSELSIEWTNQHGCGGNEKSDPHKLNCDIVLQYMCQTSDGTTSGGQLKSPDAPQIPGAESLRDGAVTSTPGTMNSLTDTGAIANNQNKGHHESERYYFECQTRSRNKGLFTADQKVNGQTAQYTRQNPNGNRRGLECPEERDYYPYWSPSPWRDIVLLTDHTEKFCDGDGKFNGASQNNNDVYKCVAPAGANTAVQLAAMKTITKETCVVAGGVWTAFTHGIEKPLCQQAPWTRVNHLGNVIQKDASGNFIDSQPVMWNWTLPSISALENSGVYMYPGGAGVKYAKCVLRMRYNISTDDYDPYATNSSMNEDKNKGIVSPVTQNPTIDIGAGYEGVRLAVNTAQFGRTFQDRSHTFFIRTRPASMSGGKIYNLNVRGKRGNIVQVFPAVEYDFQPSRLEITKDDWVHIQWTGSNTHNNGQPAGDGQAGDAGEGRGGTDRHNLAQLKDFAENYPMPLDKFEDNMFTRSQCYKLDGTAYAPQSPTGTFSGNDGALDCSITLTTSGHFTSAAAVNTAATTAGEDFDPLLDTAPASLVGGVVMKFSPADASKSTSYNYMCTRNNNFTNRGQKGTIIIKPKH